MAIKAGGKAIIIGLIVAIGGFGVYKSGMLEKAEVAAKQSQPQSDSTPLSTASRKESNTVPSGNSLQSILDTGVIKAGVQSPSRPFYFVEGGSAKGFNVEFLRILMAQPAFSKGASIKVDTSYVVDTYAAVPEALLKSTGGKAVVDIAIDGLTFSNEDTPGVVYSIPYVDDFGYALITSGTSSVKAGDDLNGLSIGILKGDPDVAAFAKKAFPKASFVELSDASTSGDRGWINRFIKEGKVDGVIYDYPFGAAEIANTNLQFAVSKLPGSVIKYKIGVRKGDTQLLEAINMSIRKAKEDPEYLNLIRKYFMTTNTIAVKKIVSGETTYVVKHGDTLSTIAATVMGDRMKYRLIETRNNLPNPNLISVGQKLVIPSV